jgi:DNA-directed RNA polymerase I subunit RPA49
MASDAVTNRLIPAFNPDAADPSDVYSLHDIIPELEWKAMSTSPFTTATSDQDRVGLLPYKRSPWIRQHLRLIFKQEPPSKRQMFVAAPLPLISLANLYATASCSTTSP